MSAELRAPHIIGEQAARALRLELELGFAPIADLWSLIRDRGVDLAFHGFGSDGGDGLYFWNGERGLIVLNTSGRKPLRLRFTAAHELGHHEMHRHTVAKVLLTDQEIRSDSSDTSEREANAFAAELLAPRAALLRDIEGRDEDSLEPVDVVKLMRRYGVSYESLLYRLMNVGAISSRSRQRLETAGKGQVRNLERALGFDEEAAFGHHGQSLPEEFVLNVVHLYHEGAIDDERLAELLRKSRASAVELAREVQPTAAVNDPEIDRLLGLGNKRSRRAPDAQAS